LLITSTKTKVAGGVILDVGGVFSLVKRVCFNTRRILIFRLGAIVFE